MDSCAKNTGSGEAGRTCGQECQGGQISIWSKTCEIHARVISLELGCDPGVRTRSGSRELSTDALSEERAAGAIEYILGNTRSHPIPTSLSLDAASVNNHTSLGRPSVHPLSGSFHRYANLSYAISTVGVGDKFSELVREDGGDVIRPSFPVHRK